jgi:hypothetical protein
MRLGPPLLEMDEHSRVQAKQWVLLHRPLPLHPTHVFPVAIFTIMRQCVTFREYPKNSHPQLELYSKSETAEVPTQNKLRICKSFREHDANCSVQSA